MVSGFRDMLESAIIQIWDEITLDESNAEIDELPDRMKVIELVH